MPAPVSSLQNPIRRLGLIAGEGQLPVRVAQNARTKGIDVVSFALSTTNSKALKALCNGQLHHISPGLLQQNLDLLKQEQVSHLVFAGKVNKWLLLRNPRLDAWAIQTLRTRARLNDDGIMLWMIQELEKAGIQVVQQTAYLQELFLPAGLLSQQAPTEQDKKDIQYGFELAKAMGRLDVGQSIVVKGGMLIAVEAIEGTDECLKRAGQWTRKKGGVVVKVAKPDQDQRFDVPTVGLRTLKTMKKAGLKVLATEADATLYLEPEAMVAYANRHNLTLISVSPQQGEGV